MMDFKNNYVLLILGLLAVLVISFIIYRSKSVEGFNTLPANAIPFRYLRISKDIYPNINYNTMDDNLELRSIALFNNSNQRYSDPAMKIVANSNPTYGTVNSIVIRDGQATPPEFFASQRGFVILDFGKELNALDFRRLEITVGNSQDNNTKSRINGVTVMLLDKDGKPLNNGVPLVYNRTTNSPTVSLSMNPNSAQFFALESACNPAKNGSCYLQLSEIRIMNTTNTNIALNKPNIMTQSLDNNYFSEKAVDNILTNMVHTTENGGIFIVDLGSDMNISDIDRVEIYNRFEGNDQWMMRQEGQKNSFVNLVKGSNVDNTYQVIPASDLTYLFYRQKPEINQIIVSSRNDSTALNLSELAIYTDDNTRLVPGMTGVSVTYESLGGIFDNNFAVPNTYDGKINTKYHTAAGNKNTKLKITFPPRRDIKRIVFDHRDECCNDRVSNGGSIVISGATGFSAEYKFGNIWTKPNDDRFNYSFDLLNGRDIRAVDLPVNNQKFLVKDPHKNKCVDDRGATTGGQQLYVSGCGPNNQNQQWTYDHSTGLIKNANKNLCWDDGGWSVGNKNSGNPKMTTQPCDRNNQNQIWRYSTRTRQFYNPNKQDQCIDSGDGNSMHLWECTMNNGNQRFDIVRI
jgi:hypothetical protein